MTVPAVVEVGRGTVAATAGVVGLLVGSFLNVVAFRVPRRLSVVEPRSFCPHCQTPIGALDNVPLLSWVVLRGRCRHCGAPIAPRYPLVELAGGVLFAAVGWGVGPHGAVVGLCVLAGTLLALSVIAVDGEALPVSVAAVGTLLAVVALVVAGAVDRAWGSVVAVLGATVVAGTLVELSRRAAGDTWRSAAPALLPAAAAVGWLSGLYVAEGVAGTGMGALALWLLERRHTAAASTRGARVALTLGLAFGAAAATATALALGAGAGR